MIFLDHMMPNMDGVETLHQMEKMETNQNTDTPVIMLTANAIVGAKEEYLREGFSDYLTKPIQETELLDMLRTYLPKVLYHQDQEKQKNSGDSSKNISKTKMEQLQQIAGFEAYIGVKIE